MFPQTGEWAGGEAAFPAALKALDQINQREDILPGYYLNLSAYDTKVNNCLFFFPRKKKFFFFNFLN
jgi:gamma-aminobutyric acid type B receptor